jgi:hypothetical protein
LVLVNLSAQAVAVAQVETAMAVKEKASVVVAKELPLKMN